MPLTVAAIVEELERFAPPSLAGDWDNVGLLLGERSNSVERVMTCLTLTPECAAEAVAERVQLVITHHPILFRPIKRLTDATPEGRMLLTLVRAGVAVYSPHTAFDNTRDGINEMLAQMLSLSDCVPLRRQPGPKSCKLVVFVPDADLQRLSDGLFAAGAGHIGQYRECSFRLAGTGTFFGSDATNPAVGQKGRREEVSEWRLEVICPEQKLDGVVAALRRNHSYEEPAFDIYPLQPQGSALGDGRIGALKEEISLGELARRVKDALRVGLVQVVGDLQQVVKRVAIVCGAGGELFSEAVRARADVFLTGEVRFHDYLAAQAQNVALILPGHYATERPGVERLAESLQTQWPELRVWASRREADPVRCV
jgi:dinuclear metal center YbgI/SA1388 family protein